MILEAWAQLVEENYQMIKSSKPYTSTLKNDGMEDSIIHYFKGGSPCLESASLLKDQVNILT